MLAVIKAYRDGLFNAKVWSANLIAGLVVGIVALPLAMAFAIASGAKPEQGIYTAIVAAIVVALCGGSRVQIAGPTAAFIVILANITAQYGMSGLQVATLMAGVILLVMGFIKLGTVIKFIPEPVIVGFTSGIGVTIFVGQWQNFFGLNLHTALDASFYQKLIQLVQALPHLNIATAILGCLSLLLVILTPLWVKRIPGSLIAMLFAMLVYSVLHLNQVATLGSAFGGIPQHLPAWHFPTVSLAQISHLLAPAFTIALLGAIESLLSAAVADGMTGTRHDSNQELIGQGLANIFSPLFGGIAATGAIARTATNIRNGGTSPIAAITHSAVLIIFLLVLAPYAKYVPLCALSAVLFVVAYNMSDFKHFFYLLGHAPWYDALILLLTFFLTIFTNLVIAVNVGVLLSILFFLYRMYQSTQVTQERMSHLDLDIGITQEQKIATSDTVILTIEGPFFFGVARKIEQALLTTHTAAKKIIFRFNKVPFIDATGLQIFREVLNEFQRCGIEVYVCEANQRVTMKLQKMDIMPLVQGQKSYAGLADIFTSLHAKAVSY